MFLFGQHYCLFDDNGCPVLFSLHRNVVHRFDWLQTALQLRSIYLTPLLVRSGCEISALRPNHTTLTRDKAVFDHVADVLTSSEVMASHLLLSLVYFLHQATLHTLLWRQNERVSTANLPCVPD